MHLELLNPLRWKKSFLIGVLFVLSVVWFVFFDTYSLLTRYQLSQRQTDLVSKTATLKKETELLEQKINRLRNDTALIEQIAREQYGMQKPGETVYKIKSQAD